MEILEQLQQLAERLHIKGLSREACAIQTIVRRANEQKKKDSEQSPQIRPGGASAPFVNSLDREEERELYEHTWEKKKELDERIAPAPDVKDPNFPKRNLVQSETVVHLDKIALQMQKGTPQSAKKFRRLARQLETVNGAERVQLLNSAGTINGGSIVPAGTKGIAIQIVGKESVKLYTDAGDTVITSPNNIEVLSGEEV